jgi:hypothetical protein
MGKGMALIGLVVALVALAGCGGSDSSSSDGTNAASSSGEPLTKAEFVEQADAICADRTPEREALQGQAEELANEINNGADRARDELADLLAEAADNAEQEFSELRALVPPASDAALVNSMLYAAGSQVALTREGAEDLRAGDFKAFTEVTENGSDLKDRASRIAQEYGLEVCGAEAE